MNEKGIKSWGDKMGGIKKGGDILIGGTKKRMTKVPQTQFKLKKTKFLLLLPGLNESRENENYETLSKN